MQHFTPTVSVSAKDLRRTLGFCAQVVDRRTTIPVLSTCRFEVGDGRIRITGSNLDAEVTAECGAHISTPPFAFTLSPRALDGILRWAPDQVNFALDGDVLRIRADDFFASFRSLCPALDFPEMTWPLEQKAPEVATISEAQLHKALLLTALTISTEETRYYLNGVFLTPMPETGLRTVSTDGHRMTIFDTRVPWSGAACILPRDVLTTLLRLLRPNGNRVVRVGQMDIKLEFSTDDWRIRAKCIDGTFPNYTKVIPTESDAIEVTLTAAALNRFPATNERTRVVAIDGDAGRMTLKTFDGSEFTMPITGRGQQFGVNLDYLRGFARQSGTIKLMGVSPGDPFRIVTEDPDLLQILMPMRV